MAPDLTLAEILHGTEAPALHPCSHETVAARLGSVVRYVCGSARFACTVSDQPGYVSELLRGYADRSLGDGATWIRFVDEARGRGLLAVLHCPHPALEAELILLGHRGMLTRSLIRGLCRWAFYAVGLRRVVVRVRPFDNKLADYLHRAGFEFEGSARDFFGQDDPASVWVMTTYRCPWLPHLASAIPTVDTSPPSSMARH